MNKLKLKTIGILVALSLLLTAITLINLAYQNLKHNPYNDLLWDASQTKFIEQTQALQNIQSLVLHDGILSPINIPEGNILASKAALISKGINDIEADILSLASRPIGNNDKVQIATLVMWVEYYKSQFVKATQGIDFSPNILQQQKTPEQWNGELQKTSSYFSNFLYDTLLDKLQFKQGYLNTQTETMGRESIIAALIVLLATLTIIWFLRRRVITPLYNLQRAMSAIAVGDYSINVPEISKRDEIGDMARALEILRDDAAELENIREEQLRTAKRIALAEKKASEEASKRLIEQEKARRKIEELKSKALAEDVEKQTRELRKSEESLRGILNSVLDAFVGTNEKGEIFSFNKAAEKMFGYSKKEAIGQSINILLPKSFINKNHPFFSKLNNITEPINLGADQTIFGRHKNGKKFPIYISMSKLNHDDTGDENEFIAVIRDISDEVKNEQKLKRLGRLLDRSMREVYVLEADTMHLQEVNSRAVDVLGYDQKTIKNLNYTDILTSPSQQDLDVLLQPLISGEQEDVVFEGVHVCNDGSEYPVEVNLHYWTNETPPVFLAVAQDMTARLKVRQEILDARDAAESASKAKSFFLANMSHELRTPLNAVLGYSEMLMEIADENNHPEYGADLDKINIAAEHLLSLINDILDLSKITSGKAEIIRQSVDLHELIREAGALITPLAHAGNNRLIIDTAKNIKPIYSDGVRIRQVLVNILSNASKFTQNGTITLTTEMCKKDHVDQMRFKIKDTGVGIPAEKIKTIFDEFSQAHSEFETKIKGSGLGLTISRRLCHAMHGDIQLKSEFGIGTTVTITLPCDIDYKKRLVGLKSSGSNVTQLSDHMNNNIGAPQKKRIIIIEDDIQLSYLMKAYLEIEDYDVTIAHSGTEGLELIKNFKPTAVLLDVSLPDMDGLEMVKKIQSDPKNQSIRIILCSGNAEIMESSIIDSSNILLKPVSRDALLKTLKNKTAYINGAAS